MTRSILIAASLSLSIWAIDAKAELAPTPSSFGCTGLETLPELPTLEGKDGVFFRINKNLRMNHSFSDQIVDSIADLAQVLAANGTTLIFVPIPTKSVTMPEHLPPSAALYGFDLEIATEVQLDILRRLSDAGVLTVDARAAMRETPEGELPFFKADFHWSAAGARETARAIAQVIHAQPEAENLERTTFETTEQGLDIAFSGMRRILQRHCTDTLPEAVTMTYETTQNQPLDLAAGGLDLFGDGPANVSIALLGTSFSDSDINNFPGFLAEFAELEVVNYALTGGNQYGAMTSYLTSTEFAEAPPRFLVWENPIYNNLAQFGDLPMRELVAAAGQSCTVALPMQIDATTGTVTVDLSGYALTSSDTVFIDTHRNVDTEAKFVFGSSDGLERVKMIERAERLSRTGRFYMPLSGLWDSGATSLRVETKHPFTSDPSVYLCPSQTMASQTKDES